MLSSTLPFSQFELLQKKCQSHFEKMVLQAFLFLTS